MKFTKIVPGLAIFLLICEKTVAQEQNNLVMSYDEAGNMTERKLQVTVAGRFENQQARDTTEIMPQPNFKIFPNPTNSYLNIEGDLPKDFTEAKVSILAINGQVLKQEIYMEGQPKTIQVNDLKSGVYILEMLYSEKERNTYKIIITN